MSHSANTEILENIYEEILDDLTAKNIQLGIMLPMEHLEAIAAKHANQKFEMMCLKVHGIIFAGKSAMR